MLVFAWEVTFIILIDIATGEKAEPVAISASKYGSNLPSLQGLNTVQRILSACRRDPTLCRLRVYDLWN